MFSYLLSVELMWCMLMVKFGFVFLTFYLWKTGELCWYLLKLVLFDGDKVCSCPGEGKLKVILL